MTNYRVNQAGVRHAQKLIDSGAYDDSTEWSDTAPSADEENRHIDQHGYDGYGEWHLALDQEANDDTKSRYGFPFGDFSKVNRAALIHARQRASQNNHDAVAKEAGRLLERLDAQREK